MRGRARGVAHIVQTVEERDEIEVLLLVILRRPDFEPGIRRRTVLASVGLGVLDRTRMKIVADELRVGKSLRHDRGRYAMAAADIGDLGAFLQFGNDAVERR